MNDLLYISNARLNEAKEYLKRIRNNDDSIIESTLTNLDNAVCMVRDGLEELKTNDMKGFEDYTATLGTLLRLKDLVILLSNLRQGQPIENVTKNLRHE